VRSMPTESFSEEKVVESPIVQKLQDVGWRFIKADELQRESLEEPLLIADVIRSIKKLNPGVGIGDEEINKVLNELRLKSSTFDGIKQVLDYFKNGVYVKFEKDKVTRPVKLFDYKNIGNNDFVVTRQPWYQGKEKKRLDIVLYVNGIPLVNIECKDPTKPAESSYHAYRQIVDYWKVLPELYKYVQIGVGVCETAWYFPIVPWHDEAKRERWKSKSKDSIDSIIEMLKPDILMDLVKNFIFVREERGFSTKVIVRYMQYRAVNKIVDRVLDNMKNGSQPNKGLIWHWQGSGKTLEMIFAANKLFSHLGNPTIFVILDRRDLQKQFNEEYNALHISPLPERIKSKEDLLSILKHD